MHLYDLVIVGAGPAGLAASIAAKKLGLEYRVFEKGVLVNSIFHFPSQMVFFTTPELLEIGGLPFPTARDKPSRDETLRYYRKVVDAYELKIEMGQNVTSISRGINGGGDGFTIDTQDRQGYNRRWQSRMVVIANGTYDRPNMLGIPGENLPHVSHYYTEPHEFYRKDVVIVGGKNSAVEAALDLYRTGANVTLVHRREELGDNIKYWVRPDIENRIKEGAINVRFEARIIEIHQTEVVVERHGAREILPAQGVFLLTGYLADLEFLQQAGVDVDASTNIPTYDPNTFETNISGLFLAGSVVAGANRGQVFIENGRFHGQVVVEEIAKRLALPKN